MWFFNSFSKSLYDLNWLRKQRKELKKAFGYFFLLVFFFAGLNATPVLVKVVQGDFANEVKTALQEKVPDFSASVANGELTIEGVEQPYITEEDGFLMVVDTVTTNTISLEDYLTEENTGGFLITKDKLEALDNTKGQFRSQTWKDVDDWSVNRGKLIGWADKFLSKPMIFVYFLLFFIAMYIGLAIGQLFFTLIVSLLVLLATKITKKQWRFKEIFAVGLYAVTLMMVVSALLFVLGLTIKFLTSIVFLVWLGAVVLLDEQTPVKEIEK